MNPAPNRVRFIVSAPRVELKVVGWMIGVWFLVVGLGVGGAQALFSADVARYAMAPIIVLSLLGYVGFLIYALTPKEVPVDLVAGGLAIDGRGGLFPIYGAKLGVWNVPTQGVAAGTALHLTDGERRYCIGGRDHRLAPGTRLEALPVESVDGYMPAAELDALLAAISPQRAPEIHSPLPLSTAIRCLLTPNRASSALRIMLPWFLTLLLIGVVNGTLAALGISDSAWGENVGLGVTIALVVAGIAVTAVRQMRTPKPALAVEMDAGVLRVVDLATSRFVVEAPIANVKAERARHVYGGRTSFTMPVLVLLVPDEKPIRIGVPDLRFSWSGEVAKSGAPTYVVGGADWLALVELLGARSFLEVGPG